MSNLLIKLKDDMNRIDNTITLFQGDIIPYSALIVARTDKKRQEWKLKMMQILLNWTRTYCYGLSTNLSMLIWMYDIRSMTTKWHKMNFYWQYLVQMERLYHQSVELMIKYQINCKSMFPEVIEKLRNTINNLSNIKQLERKYNQLIGKPRFDLELNGKQKPDDYGFHWIVYSGWEFETDAWGWSCIDLSQTNGPVEDADIFYVSMGLKDIDECKQYPKEKFLDIILEETYHTKRLENDDDASFCSSDDIWPFKDPVGHDEFIEEDEFLCLA